jgi:hypothetical protein
MEVDVGLLVIDHDQHRLPTYFGEYFQIENFKRNEILNFIQRKEFTQGLHQLHYSIVQLIHQQYLIMKKK